MEEEVPIKIELTRLVNLLDSLNIESEVLTALKKARNMLYVCSHCKGETDSYGTCMESSLSRSIIKRNSV
jgi:hypothetical protein